MTYDKFKEIRGITPAKPKPEGRPQGQANEGGQPGKESGTGAETDALAESKRKGKD